MKNNLIANQQVNSIRIMRNISGQTQPLTIKHLIDTFNQLNSGVSDRILHPRLKEALIRTLSNSNQIFISDYANGVNSITLRNLENTNGKIELNLDNAKKIEQTVYKDPSVDTKETIEGSC
jgi:hypothetical protein